MRVEFEYHLYIVACITSFTRTPHVGVYKQIKHTRIRWIFRISIKPKVGTYAHKVFTLVHLGLL